MKLNVISRRDFIKISSAAAAILGINQISFAKEFLKNERQTKNPAVVWIEGQDCAGCTESVLTSTVPDLKDILLDVVTFRFHPTLMAGTGEVAIDPLLSAIDEGGFVLVVEGSIPSIDPRYNEVAGFSIEQILITAARNAEAVLAVGACATFGGVPGLGVTEAKGVDFFLNKHNVNKPLINLPGCPVHPIWFFDTVIDYLSGNPINLDGNKRPKKHYGKVIHSECERRPYYNQNLTLKDWNDPAQKDYCLINKGCQGWKAHADCHVIKWNQGVNWCVGNNAPCIACVEPDFLQNAARKSFGPIDRSVVEKSEREA